MKSLLILTCCILELISCKNNNTVSALKLAETQLQEGNRQLLYNTENKLEAFEAQMLDARTLVKTKHWLPIAKSVDSAAQRFRVNLSKVTLSGNIDSLHALPKQYLAAVKNLNEQMWQEMGVNLTRHIQVLDSTILTSWKTSNQEEQAVLAEVLLTQLLIENFKLISYCQEMCRYIHDSYYSIYSAIIGQNAQVLKPGAMLEINAGIGEFSRAAMPVIMVNGKPAPLTANGACDAFVRVPTTPGKYSVPVTINFKDQDGKPQTIARNIDYEVR